MDREERLHERLCQHAIEENNVYLERMKRLPATEIILRASEICVKEDIYFMIVEGGEFEPEDLEALARLKNPIDACYKKWVEGDRSRYNEELQMCLEDAAAEQRHKEYMKKQRKKAMEKGR